GLFGEDVENRVVETNVITVSFCFDSSEGFEIAQDLCQAVALDLGHKVPVRVLDPNYNPEDQIIIVVSLCIEVGPRQHPVQRRVIIVAERWNRGELYLAYQNAITYRTMLMKRVNLLGIEADMHLA